MSIRSNDGAGSNSDGPHPIGMRAVVIWAVALAFVLAVVTLLYLPVTGFDFSIIDDHINVYQNPHLCNPASQDIAFFWTRPYFKLYMPLTYTAWALVARSAVLTIPRSCPPGDAYKTLLDPRPFHVFSLTLHVANAALVFAILARLRFRPWSAAAGALLFEVHPMQVQAVSWITGANNLLGGFFGFLALLLYLICIPELSGNSQRLSQTVRIAWLAAATTAFLCALLSKPTTVVIPVFVMLIEWLVVQRGYAKWFAVVGLWLALSLGCAIVNANASSGDAGQVWSPLWGRPFVASDALAFYIAKLAWPARLTYDYVRKPSVVLAHCWGYMAWMLPCLVGLALALLRNAGNPTVRRRLFCAVLIFVAGLTPSLGFVPFYSQFVSTVWNHYLYIPMLGPAIGVAALCEYPTKYRRLIQGAIVLVLIGLCVQTRFCLPVWTNMSTLTENMLAEAPESALAHHNDGLIRGAAGDLDGAVSDFRDEVELQTRLQHDPGAAGNANYTLGMTLAQMGRLQEATGPLRAAFELYPYQNDYWFGLWTVLIQTNRTDDAIDVARRHLRTAPNDARANVMLGRMLLTRGDALGALPLLEAGSRLDPANSAIAFFVGQALEGLNRRSEALAEYERARQLDPNRPQILAAIQRLQTSK